MIKVLSLSTALVVAGAFAPHLALAQKTATTTASESATEEDPNDKAQVERNFEETRKHMQHHSEWSKKSGKMNDN